jgi:hypothetical protein
LQQKASGKFYLPEAFSFTYSGCYAFFFSGNRAEKTTLSTKVAAIKYNEYDDLKPISSSQVCASNFTPTKISNMLTPTFRNLNLSTILANRKNNERRPMMAKIFEKNTT